MKRLRRRHYDSGTIERATCLVLGPFTAIDRSFLRHCTLTKVVGTIWRALSKPPQRRQGPDPRPLRLVVGTPSAFWPELAYRLRVAQPTEMEVSRYFWYTINIHQFVAVVTPTNRPKLVRNRCRNYFLVAFLCCQFALLFAFFCECKGFSHRTKSDLFRFSWMC